ncbi:hypothetical protein IJ596_00965 [bacterium]|nr:hypothetical protein [bacterium]
MKKFFNIFLIFVSLFVSLGCNAQGLSVDNLHKESCDIISTKSFPSDAEVFGNFDSNETSIASSNSHLTDIFAQRKNDGIDIGPYSYQIIGNKSVKNVVPNSYSNLHDILNNISSYLEHEIMIGAP